MYIPVDFHVKKFTFLFKSYSKPNYSPKKCANDYVFLNYIYNTLRVIKEMHIFFNTQRISH